jgi:predicted nucleic acid-binding Zn ribbon protein
MGKRRRLQRSLVDQFHRTCGWCGKFIPPDTEVWGGGAKVRSEIDLKNQEGQVIEIYLARARRPLLVAVAGSDSEAKRQGYDVVFQTCSEECGKALMSALQNEIKVGNRGGTT